MLNKPSQLFWHAAGAAIVLGTGSYFSWDTLFFWIYEAGNLPAPADKWLFLAFILGAYVAAASIAGRIVSMPLCGRIQSVLLGVSSSFTFLIVVTFALRLYYSRPFLLIAFVISFFWLYIGQRLFLSASRVRYGQRCCKPSRNLLLFPGSPAAHTSGCG